MDTPNHVGPDYSRRFLRRSEAVTYVTQRYGFPCSRQWLAKLAVVGGGPTFRKAGRYPIYDPADLDLWAQQRIGPPQPSEIGDRGPLTNVCGCERQTGSHLTVAWLSQKWKD
jgi:hypothetical protein